MVPLREGKIADAEVPLIQGLDINAKSAEQCESLGEQHLTSLAQPLIVVDRGTIGKDPTHRQGHRQSPEAALRQD
jgi:hypothetical protein